MPEEESQPTDPGTLSEEEMERFLFEESDTSGKQFWNLPMIAGLSLILVGAIYIVQEIGIWQGFSVRRLAEMLPWMAGILIILLGFGVLSWRPRKKYKAPKRGKAKRHNTKPKGKTVKKQLTKSHDKKIAGVAAGVAEYFQLDPTLVRVAFVVILIFTGGPPVIIAYVLLAFILPSPDKVVTDRKTTGQKDIAPTVDNI